MNYNEIMYQIYPLGFTGAPKYNDSITESRILKVLDWVDHLEKLGVTQVYFGPVFESDKHGYDTRDYQKLDCRLGTNEDFIKVSNALHEKGIKVIVDGVFNHVGRGFWAFEDVKAHKWDSRYNDWFFIDYNNNQNEDGFWYADWEGHHELVKLNLNNPEVRNYLFESVNKWIEEFKIDGLRLDVAYCIDRGFLNDLKNFVKSKNENFFLLGEMIGGDYNLLLRECGLDTVTNYECRKGIFSALNSLNMFEIGHSLNRQFGKEQWCIYRGQHLISFVDNHDVDRIASILTDKNHLKLCYDLIYAMPGIPCIYYGSEWGAEGRRTRESDDDLRPCFEKPLWNELTDYIAKLSEIRKEYSAFENGHFENIVLQNKAYSFKRCDDKGQLTFLMNIDSNECSLNGNYGVEKGIDLITGEEYSLSDVKLPPYTAKFIYTKW